jgi:hypothetical protein
MQGRGAHMVVSAAPKNIAKQSANEKHESRMTLRGPRGALRAHTLDSRKRRNQVVPMRDTSCPRIVPWGAARQRWTHRDGRKDIKNERSSVMSNVVCSNPQRKRRNATRKKQRRDFPTGPSRLYTKCFFLSSCTNNNQNPLNQAHRAHGTVQRRPCRKERLVVASSQSDLMQHRSEVLLRGARAALLVHDVGACDHDLHGDEDGEVHAHLGGGGGYDCKLQVSYGFFLWQHATSECQGNDRGNILSPSVAGRPSVKPPLTLLIVDWSSLRCDL